MSAETKIRYELEYAMAIAEAVVHYLSPVCERIAIAGSLRRRKATVKDIEIVAVPKMNVIQADLFGTAVEEEDAIDDAIAEANRREYTWLEWAVDKGTGEVRDGDRYKKLVDSRTGVPIDLFLVRPPAQWGVIFMLRTGSSEWNQKFIKRLDDLGLRMREGRILDKKGVLDTPEEEDVFAAAKVKWKDPTGR
jgi:DNA polymerase/3'-5' exonuclease PolX